MTKPCVQVTNPVAVEESTTSVFLIGGPSGIPQVYPVPTAMLGEILDRVTIDHFARHQHYEFTGTYGRVQESDLPVFRWIYTTRIAE